MEFPTKDKYPGEIFYNSEGLFYMSGTYQSDDEDEEGTDMIIWKYDSESRVWKQIQNSIDSENREIEFTLSGSKIVAIFWESFGPSDKVSVFDLNNSDLGWRQIGSLNRAGTHFNLLTHEGVIYSFSPKNKYYEYYDECLNTWTTVTPPKWPPLTAQAEFASHNDLIYVTDATNFQDMTRPFYSFCPQKKTWKRLADYLSSTSAGHYLLSYKKSLVKIDDDYIEMYDIDDEKTWKKVKECPVAFGVCLIKKSLLDKTAEITKFCDL